MFGLNVSCEFAENFDTGELDAGKENANNKEGENVNE